MNNLPTVSNLSTFICILAIIIFFAMLFLIVRFLIYVPSELRRISKAIEELCDKKQGWDITEE